MAASARAIEAGEAFITWRFDESALQKDLRSFQRRMSNFANRLQTIAQPLATAAAALVTPLAASVRVYQNLGNALTFAAQRTGFTVQRLAELRFAADQNDATFRGLEGALIRFNRRMANAAEDGGPALRAFQELNLQMLDLQSLSREEIFARVIRELADMENQLFADQLRFELFGDNWKELMPLIADGGDTIARNTERFHELNLGMDLVAAQGGQRLTDAFGEVRFVVERMSFAIGQALEGPLTEYATWLAEMLSSHIAWIDSNNELIVQLAKIGTVVGAIAGAMLAVVGAVKLITAFVGALAVVAGAIAALFVAGPIAGILSLLGIGLVGVGGTMKLLEVIEPERIDPRVQALLDEGATTTAAPAGTASGGEQAQQTQLLESIDRKLDQTVLVQ